jgi:NAD-dependent dihydropyrimidine dehydrogenase PreA subunit
MLRMFYFSGTGNARSVAHWVARAFQERARGVEIADLSCLPRGEVRLDPGDELGLASPTHGFNFPPVTLSFLLALPRAPARNRAYVFNTRAGLRLLGLHLPGASGVAQLLAALVLLFKGYRIAAMRPVDLPSNWISLHPALREGAVRALQARCEAIVQASAERLLDGGRDFRALWDLPQDLLLAPVSVGYYLAGRFVFAKSFIASSACDGCEACVRQCPVGGVQMVGGRPFWTFRCESCMRCMNHCPKRAIETAHGFVAALFLLAGVMTTGLLQPSLGLSEPLRASALARLALETAVLLAALGAAYRLLHAGLRFRGVERLVVWTALTHLAAWGRYRARLPPAGEPPRGHGRGKHE